MSEGEFLAILFVIFAVQLGVLLFLERRRLGEEFSLEERFSLHVGLLVVISFVVVYLLGFKQVSAFILFFGFLFGLFGLIGEVIERLKR